MSAPRETQAVEAVAHHEALRIVDNGLERDDDPDRVCHPGATR